ncbi:MAG: restriction endonuclease subunit R, partial [Flavobacteriales bacterium]|nr:restriction endonuclease subunit R [Flavobacteriales bacterium]
GKTLSGILSLHEAMHRGNSKKPLIVVPNDSILKQWVDTIFETIPNAKVNVLGNLGKDYNLSKFDNKEGEITIVTYEGFNNIGFSNEITEELSSKFNYISANELKSITNTERDLQIELQKEKEIEGKMKRGKIYDWEDFGFDHLTYDEVHNANHIVGKVKIEDRRFSSDFRNQNQQTSKLGINTWMAAQYIQNRQNGRNVTLLSATPFTNKPLEYYSILSLIANKRLEDSGYFNVNNFFETFMEADNDMEIDAKGDVKFKPNVRRFKNNQLFQQLLSEFIDIKEEEDNLELIRPNKINKEYKIEQNDLTKEQYELLTQNFNDTEKGAILTHILNARLIAFSPYLSIYYDGEQPTLSEFIQNSPKLKETMNLIRQNKIDLPDSGQIIYSELAVAQFPKLKEYLIKELKYNPEEVGIITGSTSKKQRVAIQDDFNSGKIKIVIGSEAIQEGMNLQENTTDVYLLTLPYNFTSLRQVEGRAWRQGNKNENVRINFMLTNDSIDVFMLQKLQAKQARYLEAMKRGADVLDISDISTQELKTSIITNPETRAKIEIELLKKKLESEKNKFLADSAFVLRKYEEFTKVQSEVHKAENAYNRILEYSKEAVSK